LDSSSLYTESKLTSDIQESKGSPHRSRCHHTTVESPMFSASPSAADITSLLFRYLLSGVLDRLGGLRSHLAKMVFLNPYTGLHFPVWRPSCKGVKLLGSAEEVGLAQDPHRGCAKRHQNICKLSKKIEGIVGLCTELLKKVSANIAQRPFFRYKMCPEAVPTTLTFQYPLYYKHENHSLHLFHPSCCQSFDCLSRSD
jgi:hypothetical protein